ncbi:MAG: hypothetical protein HYS44_03480 [Candidatus Niyogibacteria bacterium]|nr:hypothetical protein [Candidatus Niyogibacteria bacterium]
MKKRAWIVFAGVVLVAAFFRLWDLKGIPPGLYHDEAMNGSNALWTLENAGPKLFYPDNNGREGLFINLQALSVMAFGNEPWALRLVSALFGIGTVAGMFFLARVLFLGLGGRALFGLKPAEAIALAASFFTAVSFWHLNFSRVGFRAVMAPFFLVWAMTFLWVLMRRDSVRIRHGLSIAAGALYGLGFYSYIAYRISPVLLIVPFSRAVKNRELRKGFGIFLAAAFITALPLGIYFWMHPADFLGRTAQVSIFSSDAPLRDFSLNLGKTLQMFWFRGDYNARHNVPGYPELWWPVGILFALGIAASVHDYWKGRHRASLALLWAWFFVFSLPVALSSEGLPHALRALLMFPPALILAAYGLWQVIEWVRGWFERQEAVRPMARAQLLRIRQELGVLLLVFFLAHAATTYTQYFLRWASAADTYFAFSGPYVRIAQWLKTVPADIPKYVIVNATGVPTAPPDCVPPERCAKADAADAKPVPMPAQTVMFLTDTWPQKNRDAKKLNYIVPDDIQTIRCPKACIIVPLEPDIALRIAVRRRIPGLFISTKPGFSVLYKGFSI